MAAHRYWRIRILSNCDQGGSQTLRVSGVFGYIAGDTAQKFTGGSSLKQDGNTTAATWGGTGDWTATSINVTPAWLRYDFGATAGNWKDITTWSVRALATGNSNTEAPREFYLEWSDNGTDFTISQSCYVTGWTLYETKTFGPRIQASGNSGIYGIKKEVIHTIATESTPVATGRRLIRADG